MANHKKMYYLLLQELCDKIDRFQEKINEADEVYVETTADSYNKEKSTSATNKNRL